MTITVPANTEKVKQALADALKRPSPDLNDETELANLVAESFALIETVIRLQEELGVRLVQEDLREVKTVGDLVDVFTDRMQ